MQIDPGIYIMYTFHVDIYNGKWAHIPQLLGQIFMLIVFFFFFFFCKTKIFNQNFIYFENVQTVRILSLEYTFYTKILFDISGEANTNEFLPTSRMYQQLY